jgi:hypothetical protein
MWTAKKWWRRPRWTPRVAQPSSPCDRNPNAGSVAGRASVTWSSSCADTRARSPPERRPARRRASPRRGPGRGGCRSPRPRRRDR